MDYDEKITLLESVSDLEQAETWNYVQMNFMGEEFVYEMGYFNELFAFEEPLRIAEIGREINTADPFFLENMWGLESGELHNLVDWSTLDGDEIDYACEMCGIDIEDEEDKDV